MILKNDVSTTQLQGPKIVSTLSYENIVQDVALMKHFTGLKPSQFEVLHDFLDDVCPLETINYWKSKDCAATENTRTGPKAELWDNFSIWLQSCQILQPGSYLDVTTTLGLTPDSSSFKLHINFCCLIAKNFIWICRSKECFPIHNNFLFYLRHIYQLENKTPRNTKNGNLSFPRWVLSPNSKNIN